MNYPKSNRLSIFAFGLLILFIMSTVYVSTSSAQQLRERSRSDISRGDISRRIEPERRQFRALLLANPNYFGNLETSSFEAVKIIKNNTSYEEMPCIGYNPPLKRLEAVVYIKKSYGYGGPVCSGGSKEYVRFYVDWNNNGNWADVGMTSFTAYNIPSDKALEYAVTINLDPKERFCAVENLPKVRGILSWNNPPPPNDPGFVPVWGNVLEVRIQIDKAKLLLVKDFLTLANVKLPDKIIDKYRPNAGDTYFRASTVKSGRIEAALPGYERSSAPVRF